PLPDRLSALSLHDALPIFHPDHLPALASQWQGKIAKTTEQVKHPLARLNVQPFHRAGHHGAIDTRINLSEVHRMELHGQVELIQDRKSTRLNSSHVKISYA